MSLAKAAAGLYTKPTGHVNDGSAHPPRLFLYANDWGLSELPKLPRQRGAWGWDETLNEVAAAKFDGVQCGPERAIGVRALGLRYCAAGRANSPSEVFEVSKRLVEASPDCLTLHLGWGDESDEEIDRLADAVIEASDRYGFPIYPETHRATVFQDGWRTVQALARNPRLRLNGDFSHLYCGGEMTYRGFEVTREKIRPICERVSFCHGRISNAESMQIDISQESNQSHVDNYRWLLRESMRAWLRDAGPGDVFPFVPELGPPSSGYAITYRDAQGQIAEISDRWEQTIQLCSLAKTAFANAQELR